MFTIYYNNGLFDECDGTLDEAKAMADECAGYTQCDISIEDENREEVARRRWYGGPVRPRRNGNRRGGRDPVRQLRIFRPLGVTEQRPRITPGR